MHPLPFVSTIRSVGEEYAGHATIHQPITIITSKVDIASILENPFPSETININQLSSAFSGSNANGYNNRLHRKFPSIPQILCYRIGYK